MSDVVRAAGGVIVRDGIAGPEILLVHRPQYRDWTFPKGKAEGNETDEQCALREVQEETGLVCELLDELEPTDYHDGRGRPKRVRWWRMRVTGGAIAFDDEVDEAVWLSPVEAAARLTYPRDRHLLDAIGA